VPLDALLAVWFGIAIALSGSRVALGSAVLVGVVVVAVRRSRRGVLDLVGLVGGVGIGTVITSTFGSGLSAVNRVASDSAGDRGETWSYGLDAFRDRPLLGWGLGQFRPAVQGRITEDLARAMGADRDRTLFDAHNLVVGVAVSLGVIGLVVVGVLGVLIARKARGGLAVGACALALSWLLQPMGLATFPLALLLFGASLPGVLAAAPTSQVDTEAMPPALWMFAGRRWLALLLIPGLCAGMYLAAVEASIQRAGTDGNAAELERWVGRLPADPVLSDIAAQAWQAVAPLDASAVDRSLEWSDRAVSLQGDSSRWWIRHAIRQYSFDRPEEALTSVRAGRRLEPNSWLGVDFELFLLDELGDESGLEDLMPLGCALGVPRCVDD
jgi:hypothetical protein